MVRKFSLQAHLVLTLHVIGSRCHTMQCIINTNITMSFGNSTANLKILYLKFYTIPVYAYIAYFPNTLNK